MKVVKEVIGKSVVVGGERASGWLPSKAATPLPTPISELVLDVRILEGDGEFILEWSSNGDYLNDSWHANIEEAQHEAKLQFAIEATEWREVD